MSSKEIKELRQSGKLDEALSLATRELEDAPDNIWAKRNLSWVYYEYLKVNSTPEHYEAFLSWIQKIRELQLPSDEKLLYDNVGWQIGKMVFGLAKLETPVVEKIRSIFELVKDFNFTKKTEGYSFIFKAFHKGLKEVKDSEKAHYYIEFADWWDFNNFIESDYKKEILPNGKDVMALAEQGYIAYAKHLLPTKNPIGEMVFNQERAQQFIPLLEKLADDHPEYQFPPYFLAKLLLAIGDTQNTLSSLLPFAKKKRNDFWVWDVMADAFADSPDKVFACYCKALSCRSPEEMLVNLRQRMAAILISKGLLNEAKTEIELLVRSRSEHEFRIPQQVLQWQEQSWYISAVAAPNNKAFYDKYTIFAEELLFMDVPEESIIIEFVNQDKSIANFIVSEEKFGFFKYDRLGIRKCGVGEVYKVRFMDGTNGGLHKLYTMRLEDDKELKARFIKKVEGLVRIKPGQSFGFVEDIFIHPSMIAGRKLMDGMHFTGKAIKSYNKERQQWGWKVIS
jgi:tetratricopeptide (TPR) repeat protein